jgi:demethylmenaquinone methyltransferase/2-methoxy-6-polyprenyl-1,4-benzoquinol methylase
MVEYYRARAAEYDEWFYRQGRFDRGAAANAAWFAESAEVFAAFDHLGVSGDVLELAPGTGIWTERIARVASTVAAIDASPEMVTLNRAKLGPAADNVTYFLADLFAWRPDRRYDACCFGFWISHVPLERLDAFLAGVAQALRPGGKVFFVDGRREPTSTAADHRLPDLGEQVMTRKLNDGRTFQIVKNFFDPAALAARCAAVGLDVSVRETATYFMYGVGTKRP